MTTNDDGVTATRLDPRAFGLACGLLWAVGVATIGFLARFGWANRWRDLLSDAYVGYGSSERGILVGAVWAFFDGAIGGYIFASLYDRLSGE